MFSNEIYRHLDFYPYFDRPEDPGLQLYNAVKSGSASRVKDILDNTEFKKTDPNWYGPLRKAVETGNESVVKLLLEDTRIDVNTGAPLACAAERGDFSMVKLLCSHESINLNYGELFRHSPLEIAAASGHAEIVRYLLADPRIGIWSFMMSPLISAASNGHTEVVKVLLADGRLDKNEIEGFRTNSANIGDLQYTSPLREAVLAGHIEVVRILLADNEVDVNRQTDGKSPLGTAAAAGRVKVVKLLLKDKRIDVNQEDLAGQTALHYAARNGHRSVYNIILEHQRKWFLERIPPEMKTLFACMLRMLEILDFHAKRLQAMLQASLSTPPDDLSVFPNRRRPPCTTMPWNIWPALVVLWGVCWMFYTPPTTPSLDEWDPALFPELSELPFDSLIYDSATSPWNPVNWDLSLPPDLTVVSASNYLEHGGPLQPTETHVSTYANSRAPTQTVEPPAQNHESSSSQVWLTGDPTIQPVTFTSSQIVPTASSSLQFHRHFTGEPATTENSDMIQPILDSDGRMMCDRYGCNRKTFASRSEWRKHMDKHDRPYLCTFDGCTHTQGFTSKGDLMRHQNSIHTTLATRLPNKSYWCDHNGCSRSKSSPRNRPFTRKDHLQEHVKRIHNGISAGEAGEAQLASSSSAVLQRSENQEDESTAMQNDQPADSSLRKRRREEESPCSSPLEPTAQRMCGHGQEVEMLRRRVAELEQELEASKAKEAASRARVATLADVVSQYAKQTD